MKSVLITGAAGGIGMETARVLAAENTTLVCVDIDDDALARLQKELDGLPGESVLIQNSLATVEACKKAVTQCPGVLTGMVHLAGVFVPDVDIEDDLATYHHTMDANLTNGYALAYVAAERMQQDFSDTCTKSIAAMVFTSSLAFRRGTADYVAYSAAKGGLVGMTRALSRKLAPGIRVNALAPGLIDTPMPAQIVKQRGERLLDGVCLQRMGRASEIASVIAFLMGDGASYITGQTINVDGGIIN